MRTFIVTAVLAVGGIVSVAATQAAAPAMQNNPMANETSAAVGRPSHSRVVTIQRSIL